MGLYRGHVRHRYRHSRDRGRTGRTGLACYRRRVHRFLSRRIGWLSPDERFHFRVGTAHLESERPICPRRSKQPAYAGDHYIGWSSARDGTVANFVGIRFLNSAGVWQCVIRSGGADVAAQTIPIAPDAAVHTFAVSGGSSANSVTCGIDTATQSATGTIPAAPGRNHGHECRYGIFDVHHDRSENPHCGVSAMKRKFTGRLRGLAIAAFCAGSAAQGQQMAVTVQGATATQALLYYMAPDTIHAR